MSHDVTCSDSDVDGHDHGDASWQEADPGTKAPAVSPAASGPVRPSMLRRGARHGGVLAVPEIRWAALSVVFFAVALTVTAVGGSSWLAGTLFAVCYIFGGWEPALAGLRALRERRLDVDLLMVVAAVAAAAIGQALDGGLLIVIFATSGALEALATKRTQDSISSLLTLAPEQATVVEGGSERTKAAELLVLGDEILVRPGERIGADGFVMDGVSEVDQASITGEPLPVLKHTDDEVFAGTLNGEGALRVRVSRPAAESVVARIVALVAEASATKAEAQLFIDRIEQKYSVAMVGATLLLLGIPLLLGSALQPTLLRAMTFMIVASPCAVVLATMPPFLAAIANAGRHGLLVKSAVVMEQLGLTTKVAFDKTGTLTEGTPRVDGVYVLDGQCSEMEVLRLAAGAEYSSEHPLARAIVAAAHERDIVVPSSQQFASAPGRGVTALVSGHVVRVGSPALLDDRFGDLAPVARTQVIDHVESTGGTAVVVRMDDVPIGVLGLSDRLRPDATSAVSALEQLTGRSALLLTGDNPGAARHLAAQVGITEVRARLLPHEKVDIIRTLESQGAAVMVVGDGVNDAPALAAAHVGVAMGRHGSDLALETADAVAVRDDLTTIPAVIALSRQARRVVTANLVFAGVMIVTLVAIDLLGHLPLPLGVAGHEGSTVVVGLNGLRLLRRKAWHR
jgi:heavy metal translocating P-type ATPase